jgi:hypothetical protein
LGKQKQAAACRLQLQAINQRLEPRCTGGRTGQRHSEAGKQEQQAGKQSSAASTKHQAGLLTVVVV